MKIVSNLSISYRCYFFLTGVLSGVQPYTQTETFWAHQSAIFEGQLSLNQGNQQLTVCIITTVVFYSPASMHRGVFRRPLVLAPLEIKFFWYILYYFL